MQTCSDSIDNFQIWLFLLLTQLLHSNILCRNGVFSANLVVEDNLPLADYLGTADGRDNDKMDVAVQWEKGTVLTTLILCSSPISFELEVDKEMATGKHDKVVLICRI